MERDLNPSGSDAHWCSECKKELATTGCSDAVEAADSSWSESATRYGCQSHPVRPMVRLKDGHMMSFAAYQESMASVQ